MKNIKTLLIEAISVSVMAGLLISGWQTALAADSMRDQFSTLIKFVHFVLYSLGGFVLLCAAMLVPVLIVAVIAGFFIKSWKPDSIRRFILTGLIGTLTIAYIATFEYWLDKPIYIDGNFSLRNSLTFGILWVLSYIVGYVIALGIFHLMGSLTVRTRWALLWGWWIFLATIPSIGLLLIKLFSRSYYVVGFGIMLIIALILIGFLWYMIPRVNEWLHRKGSWRLWAGAGLLVVLYLVTMPFKGAVVRGQPASEEYPPVVLITIDTLRADALTCYPEVTCLRLGTPNMDSLASEGALFENAYSAAPWTRPSVPSFLSGLGPSAHGAFADEYSKLAQGATTLAEILQESGYATGGFVVNSILKAGSGNEQGFDVYIEEMSLQDRGRMLLFQTMIDRIRLAWPDLMVPNANPLEERNAVRKAINFVEEHSGERFFLWLHLFAPHGNYYPPEEYRKMAEEEWDIRVPSIDVNRQIDMRYGWPAGNRERLDGLLALYAGEVVFADDSVGTMIETLKEYDIFDNCLTVLSSDHGMEFYDHDRLHHGHSLYPEVVHVPLIFRFPGIVPENMRIDETVSLVDLAPTVLNMVGVDASLNGEPAVFMGAPLTPLFNSETYIPRPVFFESQLHFDQEIKGVLYNDLLYIGGPESILHPRLYDIRTDPGAYANIISERPDDAEMLAGLIEQYVDLCAMIAERIGATRDMVETEQLRALGYIN